MPLVQAGATAGRRRVLRDEDWVTSVRRLLAVPDRMRGRESLCDQLLGVTAYGLRPAQLGNRAVTAPQPEPGAKWLCGKPAEPDVDVVPRH
jgi:hypothetical protein